MNFTYLAIGHGFLGTSPASHPLLRLLGLPKVSVGACVCVCVWGGGGGGGGAHDMTYAYGTLGSMVLTAMVHES